jgi:hypothetical protein
LTVAGRRIVTLVELAWATAPGDSNAEELPVVQGQQFGYLMQRSSAHFIGHFTRCD